MDLKSAQRADTTNWTPSLLCTTFQRWCNPLCNALLPQQTPQRPQFLWRAYIFSPAALRECTVPLKPVRAPCEHSHLCFHPCYFLYQAAKMNFGPFKFKCRENDLLVEFLALWIAVIPFCITSGIRSEILKEKYNGHYSQRECCQILFSDASMYMLLKLSLATESLEMGILSFSGHWDNAGGSAAVHCLVAFCHHVFLFSQPRGLLC